jgi:hypothetical protein
VEVDVELFDQGRKTGDDLKHFQSCQSGQWCGVTVGRGFGNAGADQPKKVPGSAGRPWQEILSPVSRAGDHMLRGKFGQIPNADLTRFHSVQKDQVETIC